MGEAMSPELFSRLVGNAIVGLIFLAIGYAIARAIQKRRNSQVLPKAPIVVAAILALIGVITAVNRAAQEANRIEVRVVRQPANELTDAAITAEYAEGTKAYLLDNMRANVPADAGQITAGTAGVMIVDGRSIAVHHFAVNGEETIVSILGISGGELVRVTCFTGGGRVDYRAPECATAVHQALGVDLP